LHGLRQDDAAFLVGGDNHSGIIPQTRAASNGHLPQGGFTARAAASLGALRMLGA
jgi:hypothetical protein